MVEKVKIAGVQMDPKILNKKSNLARCQELIELTAKEGVRFIIFPECALTGYCLDSREEALPLAEEIPGPSTEEIMAECRKLNVYVIVGLLEKDRDKDGDKYYNAAALLGPSGLLGKYRKLHLPYLGIDRFLDKGNLPLTVYQTEMGNIGIGICYDLMFAEHSRVLALKGADILVFPSNWPESGKVYPDYIIPTRATENHVYCVAVNRIGEERGTRFLGRSMIARWLESPLAEGKCEEEDIVYAEVEPAKARQKLHIFDQNAPAKHRVNFIEDRRPEFYSHICKVSSRLKGRH